MKTIYYAGQPGEGFGWGVCNKYLIRELSKLCNLRVVDPAKLQRFDGPLFTPLADHDLNQASVCRGKSNFGLTFFEFPLGPKARENAKLYDLIFCGSTWCKERLAERGITNTEVLVQGVDHKLFFSDADVVRAGGGVTTINSPQRAKEFYIFSGGKFEYRKGQDIVLAAFKMLQDKYPDMKLLAAWENIWPPLCATMAQSPHLKFVWDEAADFNSNIWQLCDINGINPARVGLIRKGCPQREIADHMHYTDLGVFPNRCEGGTNLVLMEYLACGKPAIATAGTGHLDILDNNFDPLKGVENHLHWVECSPEALAERIESHYTSRIPMRGDMSKWTWERAARQILDALP